MNPSILCQIFVGASSAKTALRLIASLVFAIVLSAPLHATSYYFAPAPTGNDSGAGTFASPWATLSKASGKSYNSGDQILLEGGATFTGTLTFSHDFGSSGGITITNYNPSTGTAGSGANVTIDSSGTGTPGITLTKCGGYTINNVNFVGVSGSTAYGIYINGTGASTEYYNISIYNCNVTNFFDGIYITGPVVNSGSSYDNISVTYTSCYANGDSGMITSAEPSQNAKFLTNLYVGHCQFYGNTGYNGTTGYSGNGIIVGGANGATVERCVAHGNGANDTDTSGGPGGIWCYSSNNVIIQYCESYGNLTGGSYDGLGFDFDWSTTNSIMQYNYAHENDGAGIGLYQISGDPTWGSNIIRYNICENNGLKNGYGAISLWSDNSTAMGGCEIYNNVFYQGESGSSGIPPALNFISGSTQSFEIRNNIFMTTGGSVMTVSTSNSSFVVSHNCYYDTANHSYTFSTDSAPIYGNPNFNDAGYGGTLASADDIGTPSVLPAYTILYTSPASPCIDAGLDWTTFPNFSNTLNPNDFFGQPTPYNSLYDVGAYEFSGWQQANIGSAGSYAGSSTPTNSTNWAVSGCGADIWGTADQFEYNYQTTSGDCSIVANVAACTVTSGGGSVSNSAKAGLMIRQNTTAGSPYVMMAIYPNSGSTLQIRTSAGASASQVNSYTLPASTEWLKLTYIGGTFTNYYSTDGINWTAIGSTTSVTMTGLYTYGLAVCSHSTTQLDTAQFTNVAVGWVSDDIGSPGIAGSSSVTSQTASTYSVEGSGADVWGTSDQFQYYYQNVSGDCQIIAKTTACTVVGGGTPSGSAKAGIMIRDSTAANAAYAYLALYPNSGITLQYRASTGAVAAQAASTTQSNPYWLMLTRSGSTFTASYSSTGASGSWVTLGTATVTMGTNITIGLAVTAHSNSQLDDGIFNDVSFSGEP